jgi:hypothetical protein
MTTAAHASRLPLRRWVDFDLTWVAAVAGSAALTGIATARTPLVGRMAAGAAVVGSFLVVALRSRRAALHLIFVWLAFLGFVRRALIPIIGWPRFDPLLLLAPAAAVILWYTTRERPARTTLSTLGLILLGTTASQLFNARNKDMTTALLASLFWIGPLLWFFVGRTLNHSDLGRIYRTLTILLVPVTVLGVAHSFGFFFPFEYTWVGVSGFGEAIFLSGFRIRPFSTLTSPQEYGYFLAVGLTILWAWILVDRPVKSWQVALFTVSSTALFLQSSRGIFLFFGAMLIGTACVATRHLGLRIIAVVLLTPVALTAVLHTSRVTYQKPQEEAVGGSRIRALAMHQISGFTDSSSSTLPVHRDLILHALSQSIRYPLGQGLSEGTIAEIKTRNDRGPNPENDIATVFVALGAVTGIVFLIFMATAFGAAVRRWRTRRDATSLAVIGLLIAFLTQWWSGQMYAASAVLWLTLGALSRPKEQG